MTTHNPEKSPQSSYAHAAPAAVAMAPLIDSMRSNSELMSQLGVIVARANQTMAARQAAVITEAMDDLTALMQQSMPNASDPSAAMRAYATYTQSVFRRGVAHLSFAVDSAAELSKAALELARQRYLAEPEASPAQANGKYPSTKK